MRGGDDNDMKTLPEKIEEIIDSPIRVRPHSLREAQGYIKEVKMELLAAFGEYLEESRDILKPLMSNEELVDPKINLFFEMFIETLLSGLTPGGGLSERKE